MIYKNHFQIIVFTVIFFLTLLCMPASAQDQVTYYEPITNLSLNIKNLTLNVGERYTLPLTYEPSETPPVFLKWYTDEKMIRIDPDSFTITAVSAGNTRLLTESIGGFAWDYCDITVIGSETNNAAEKKAGTELITLSDADREKIEAETLQQYIEFIDNSGFTREEFYKLAGRHFNVTAFVKPGMVSAQSELAASMGMEKAHELPDFDAVSLYGSLAQILTYAENNSDLIRIIEFAPVLPEDPIPEKKNGLAAKGMNLKDHVEALTSVSTAHDLGLKGDGTVVAIIDSGLDKNHEQFSGRVIAEYCAAYDKEEEIYATCFSGSSEPARARIKANYNHGAHAAGIAAGRDGIAPHAKIISINNAVESCVEDLCVKFILYDIMEVAEYLIDLQNEYKAAGKPQIVAVNISFGGGKSQDDCDDKYPDYKMAFDLLLENGIIPVAASGNNGYIDATGHYACLSNSFGVGALADDSNPTIRDHSNHGKMVDILAPGSKIWSALYVDDNKEGNVCYGINCYGYKSGTSMATPMVTGAFAILKQANPTLTALQLEAQIKEMSTKTANFKPAYENIPDHTFPYDTPVLDFSEIEKYIYDPESHHNPDFWPINMTVLPRTGFSSVRPQILPAMPKDLKYEPLKMLLEIPLHDVLSEIVKVPVLDNEYAVTWLGDSVGLLEGSALPGKGTVVLAAHNHLNNTEIGPFALLSLLEEGERIFICDNSDNLLTYVVYANVKAAETDFETIDRIADTSKNVLIMITCEDETVSGGYASRRIVAAKTAGEADSEESSLRGNMITP